LCPNITGKKNVSSNQWTTVLPARARWLPSGSCGSRCSGTGRSRLCCRDRPMGWRRSRGYSCLRTRRCSPSQTRRTGRNPAVAICRQHQAGFSRGCRHISLRRTVEGGGGVSGVKLRALRALFALVEPPRRAWHRTENNPH